LIIGCMVVDRGIERLQAGSLRYSRLETCATSGGATASFIVSGSAGCFLGDPARESLAGTRNKQHNRAVVDHRTHGNAR